MSGTASRPPDGRSGFDPWWGDMGDDAAQRAAPAATRPRRRTRPTGAASARRRRGIGWLLLGLLVAPLDALRRAFRRSPRLRRMSLRLAVVGAILLVLACSVGVILINNVVIGRTAELGRLEDQRRELRRDNAMLGAQSARLKSPDLIYRRATKELGMVQTDTVPEFIYLYDGSRELTAFQRRRIAAAAQRRAGARERKARSTEATEATP